MEDDPLFFLHFPRTAGTTVDAIFFSNFPKEAVIKIYSQNEFRAYREIDKKKLQNIQYITGHLILESLNPPQFYGRNVRAFTFLRDPVKRLYSEYIFLKTWKSQHLYEYLNSRNISFSQYVRSTEKLLKYRGKNFMTRCLSGEDLEKCDLAEALEKAKYNLVNNLIFFGIQEKFLESMLLLSRKARLKNILHQKRNSLNYAAASTQKLTKEEEELAREYNQADIELYDYATRVFDERIKAEGAKFIKDLQNYRFLNEKFQHIADLLYESVDKDEKEIKLSKDVDW